MHGSRLQPHRWAPGPGSAEPLGRLSRCRCRSAGKTGRSSRRFTSSPTHRNVDKRVACRQPIRPLCPLTMKSCTLTFFMVPRAKNGLRIQAAASGRGGVKNAAGGAAGTQRCACDAAPGPSSHAARAGLPLPEGPASAALSRPCPSAACPSSSPPSCQPSSIFQTPAKKGAVTRPLSACRSDPQTAALAAPEDVGRAGLSNRGR